MSRIDLVALSHETVAQTLREDDVAIDATVGNGHDLLFLASTVGSHGHVYGFDIQRSAISTARKRLEQHSVVKQVSLIESGHETLAAYIPVRHQHHIKSVMFNLGYLPGAD